jgi:hydrogenase nickel incorporation protein HypB
MTEKINVQASALTKNDLVAAENRAFITAKGILAINLISSPGSGKTSLLEAMAKRLGSQMAVVTGDVQMTFDADRINQAGSRAVQIETHGSCHLNATVVKEKLESMDLNGVKVLVIENVGNLVCPSNYDLGECFKVALLSVTEGDEKPLKYPALFVRAAVVMVTKMDLLPHVSFDIERVKGDCLKLNPETKFFTTSAKTGEGLDEWVAYLQSLRPQ